MNNTIKTFDTFDKFGLKQFAEQLTKYLLVEAQFVEGSFVLSLNSEFGSGKTTFFEMWKEKLESGENPTKVVMLNAWQSDFQGDALLSIISGLLDAFGSSIKKTEKESIKETAGKLSKFALSIGNDVVNRFTGVDFIKAGERAENGKSKKESTLGHACFEVYHKKQEIFNELKLHLTNLTKESKAPIIIIIDELDRCRPTYAIEYLETIKHFFDINGLIFVLGVDIGQFESSAKALFGQGLNFYEYYRKFAHRNTSLPVKSPEMINKFCLKLINEYLSLEAFKKRNRFSYIKHDQYRAEDVVILCEKFSLNARQMHELFRISAHVFSLTKESKNYLLWGWHIGVLFMTTLSIKDKVFYQCIGQKEVTLKEFTEFLKRNIFSQKLGHHGFWWAALLYLGNFPTVSPEEFKKEFISLGIWDEQDKVKEAFKGELSTFVEAYSRGHFASKPVFYEIYEMLEQVKTFEK
jgi:hypothetical protein